MTRRRVDPSVEMNATLDDYFYHLLEPLCGKLTVACVDAAWEAVVGVLAEHAQREANLIAKRAARRASKKEDA